MRFPLRLLISMVVAAFAFSAPGLASADCERTEEYMRIRTEIYQSAYEPLERCKQSVREVIYWKAVADCVKNKQGENIGGGCAHIAGYARPKTPIDDAHCEVLRPSEPEFTEFFLEAIRSKGIPECK